MTEYNFYGIDVKCGSFKDVSGETLEKICRIRKNAFIDRRKWNVDSYDGSLSERDRYDDESSYYLYLENNLSLDGCVRLRPSYMPNLLSGALEHATGGKRKISNKEYVYWEASRFCLIPYSGKVRSLEITMCIRTHAMFMGMIAFGISFGIHGFEVVVDESMRRILRMCGWPLSIICTSKGRHGESIYYGSLPCSIDQSINIKSKAERKIRHTSSWAATE